MSAPSGEPTATPTADPHPFDPKYAPAPAPADPAATPAPAPVAPVADGASGEPETDPAEQELPQWVKDKIAKANREAKNLRDRLKEAEPLVEAARAAEEANKTELQRATERAAAAEQALTLAQQQAETNGLAAKYGIPESHFRYLVGSTPEEREDAAAGIATMLQAANPAVVTPPPSNRPVANLLPGASPVEAAHGAPTEYPSWFGSYLPKR